MSFSLHEVSCVNRAKSDSDSATVVANRLLTADEARRKAGAALTALWLR